MTNSQGNYLYCIKIYDLISLSLSFFYSADSGRLKKKENVLRDFCEEKK